MGQTVSKTERETIIEAATPYTDGVSMTHPIYPIGTTPVPSSHPNWGYNSPEGTWQGNHLTLCLTDGMTQSKVKPTTYQKLATIHQSSSENPTVFVE